MNISRYAGALLAFILAAVSLTACDVQTFDEAASNFNNALPPPPPPPPPPAGFGANFSEIQASVFTPSCATAGCHSGANAAAGLNLEEANSYAELVGIASNQDAGIERVNAGNPDISYLIQKLEGTVAGSSQMPLGATPLAQADIDVIRLWITNGAVDDRVAPPAAAIRVTSLAPMPGAVLAAAPTQIVAGFDQDLDVTSVNLNTFIVTASGGDGTFGEANDVQITATSITVPAANQRSAVFDLTGTVLADDTYRVRLPGSGASLIMDLNANALDGEFAGLFPSGNGLAGGDFIAQFAISTPVVIGPTLDQIQTVIFTPTCATTGCHTGAGAAAGLNLSDADTSFLELVGVASSQNAAILRVSPTDPDNSYLIQKLDGNAGTQMPLNRPALAPTDIAEIRQWITDGALRQ